MVIPRRCCAAYCSVRICEIEIHYMTGIWPRGSAVCNASMRNCAIGSEKPSSRRKAPFGRSARATALSALSHFKYSAGRRPVQPLFVRDNHGSALTEARFRQQKHDLYPLLHRIVSKGLSGRTYLSGVTAAIAADSHAKGHRRWRSNSLYR